MVSIDIAVNKILNCANTLVFELCKGEKKPLILCLGFFDGIHNGHIKLFERAEKLAKFKNCEYGVFTFSDLDSNLKGGQGQVFSFEEKKVRLAQLGLKNIVTAKADKDFLQQDGKMFLDLLFAKCNIQGLVVGKDYRFGAKAGWGIDYLRDYCKLKNVECEIIDIQEYNSQKISTSQLKDYIKSGNINEVNARLPLPYFCRGRVEYGRSQGREIGFPTANIYMYKDKISMKEGVYYTLIKVQNKIFKAVSNVGTHPTFDDFDYNIESFILDFDEVIYGEIIDIYFIEKIRGLKKFANAEELRKEISANVEFVAKKELK